MTDAALAMSAFSPGDRQPGRAPDEVAAKLSDEDIMKGPLAGIFQGIKVLLNVPPLLQLQEGRCMVTCSHGCVSSIFEGLPCLAVYTVNAQYLIRGLSTIMHRHCCVSHSMKVILWQVVVHLVCFWHVVIHIY